MQRSNINLCLAIAVIFITFLPLQVLADSPDMVWVYINDPGVSGHEGFTGYMSKYETTNAQYCQYLNAALASGDVIVDGSYVKGADGLNSGADFVGQIYYNLAGSGITYNGATNGGATRINYSGGVFSVDSGFDNHPVTYVHWYGAAAFCNYYGYRLPTEWEWQAVADYDGSYTYGCGPNINNSIANYYNSTHPDGTTVVGSFGTYGYGMCDMAGNVYEWTSTTVSWGGSGWHATRGGSWYNYDDYCTVSHRNSSDPYGTGYFGSLGFRVVLKSPSYPISDPITGTATQAGSDLGEADPNRMVEIANGDVCIKFVPIVSGGGSVTITELSCQTIEGDGVIIVENIRGIRAITALDNGDYVSTLKVFYEEQDLPEGWTERDLRIAQLQGVMTMPRWVAEFALGIMNPSPTYGSPTLELGDWGVDEEGNYVWANVDHFSDYGVGVKLVTGDYDGNRNVDFRDFSHFALNWQDVNCPDFEWCNGTDLDFSTVVDFNDLQILVGNWLYDANDPNTW